MGSYADEGGLRGQETKGSVVSSGNMNIKISKDEYLHRACQGWVLVCQ